MCKLVQISVSVKVHLSWDSIFRVSFSPEALTKIYFWIGEEKVYNNINDWYVLNINVSRTLSPLKFTVIYLCAFCDNTYIKHFFLVHLVTTLI